MGKKEVVSSEAFRSPPAMRKEERTGLNKAPAGGEITLPLDLTGEVPKIQVRRSLDYGATGCYFACI
jgi:hypothetical protein